MQITSPTDLSLLAAAVNDKIGALDAGAAFLAEERQRLGAEADIEVEAVTAIMRTAYVRLARQIEQALDVPFVDQDEAVRMLFAEGTVVVGIRP